MPIRFFCPPGRFVFGVLLVLAGILPSSASEGRILKVLPHLLDARGRPALAPSLFQRDAYQAHLRQHPDEVSTIRYDVNWQARRSVGKNLRVQLMLRTANRAPNDPLKLETAVEPHWFGRAWTSLQPDAQIYRAVGKVLAWKVTLFDGETVLGTQQSFLW